MAAAAHIGGGRGDGVGDEGDGDGGGGSPRSRKGARRVMLPPFTAPNGSCVASSTWISRTSA